MTLATIEALNKNNWEYSEDLLNDIMNNFSDWYLQGKFAVNNNRFDIGDTCEKAIKRYIVNENTLTCGITSQNACGNGALMRMLPLSYLTNSGHILKVSKLTHNNILCDTTSLIYCLLINKLNYKDNKESAFNNVVNHFKRYKLHPELDRLMNKDFKYIDVDSIKSTGYCVDTLEAAIWCFLNTDNYEDCVIKAVNLGEDADTVAAVAGGLAGTYYGINEINGIPDKWIQKLRDIDTLKNIVYNENLHTI